jgi:hypothetical protein
VQWLKRNLDLSSVVLTGQHNAVAGKQGSTEPADAFESHRGSVRGEGVARASRLTIAPACPTCISSGYTMTSIPDNPPPCNHSTCPTRSVPRDDGSESLSQEFGRWDSRNPPRRHLYRNTSRDDCRATWATMRAPLP